MASNTSGTRTFTFHHVELGPMTGLVTPDNVVQFRAVPYASIPARFKQSILLDSLPETAKVFTEHGNACPQTFPTREADGGLFPGEAPIPASDEFQCLILQLNIPLACLQTPPTTTNLPVLVYIHGGGFVLGRIDEQHNTALLVEQSLLDSRPIVSASIQYRLGALGYLHTPESGNANLALNDQRTALLWLQRFIGGFGGDSKRVTVFGESAGAISLCAHMLSAPPPTGPLFTRTILMSGIIGPATAPITVGEAEKRYEEFLARLGIHERGGAGLDKLREVDIQDLVTASSALGDEGGMWLSVRDEEWFGPDAARVTWDRIPELIGECAWVDDIVLGTTEFEGLTMASRYASIPPSAFITSLTQQLGQASADLIGSTYGIAPTMDQNLFLTCLLRWVGDVLFDAPTHALASHLSTISHKKVHRYLFAARNPFPANPLYQQAHHWVDIYYIFKMHQFRFPSKRLRDLSTQHARFWVGFANGDEPWGQYVRKRSERGDGKEVIMLASEHEGWVEKSVSQLESELEWGWGRCEGLVQSWRLGGMEGRGWGPLDLECLSGVGKT